MDILVLGMATAGFVLGLFLLIYGADKFVDGAANIAKSVGVSEHVIGLTLVAFATSLPELASSSIASYQGYGDLALGNVVGSNIANICLVLGSAALFTLLKPSEETTRDAIFMVIVSLILFIFFYFNTDGAGAFFTGGSLDGLTDDRVISRFEGALMLVIFVAYTYYLFKTLNVGAGDEVGNLKKEGVIVALGVIAIGVGGWVFVRSSVSIAYELAVTTAFIGLSIVALGTSIPELTTSIVAAWKEKQSISIGNVLGSNIINILLVLGVAAMIAPIDLSGASTGGEDLMFRTIPLMLYVSFLAFLFCTRNINRLHAIFLLSHYVLFLLVIFPS
jgi:cation:H+ antiporter